VGHNEGPGIEADLKAGAEDLKKGSTGLFKPYRQHRIVDMPYAVGIAKAGLYRRRKHSGSLSFQYKISGR
jgi:hypothetical protein